MTLYNCALKTFLEKKDDPISRDLQRDYEIAIGHIEYEILTRRRQLNVYVFDEPLKDQVIKYSNKRTYNMILEKTKPTDLLFELSLHLPIRARMELIKKIRILAEYVYLYRSHVQWSHIGQLHWFSNPFTQKDHTREMKRLVRMTYEQLKHEKDAMEETKTVFAGIFRQSLSCMKHMSSSQWLPPESLRNFYIGFSQAMDKMLMYRHHSTFATSLEACREGLSRRLKNAGSKYNCFITIDGTGLDNTGEEIPLCVMKVYSRNDYAIVEVKAENVVNSHAIIYSDGSGLFDSECVKLDVPKFFQRWNNDPEFFNVLFGISVGRCIFCNRPLHHKKSKENGAGNRCRQKYQDIWKDIHNDARYAVENTETKIADLSIDIQTKGAPAAVMSLPDMIMQASSILRDLCEDGEVDIIDSLAQLGFTQETLEEFAQYVQYAPDSQYGQNQVFKNPSEMLRLLDYLGLDEFLRANRENPQICMSVVFGQIFTQYTLRFTN